jgi:beta-phosphoglucomutase-like phosphatase (HAD superfamily)
MRFDLVIFDCDGVLIDSELLSIEADIACLAEYGIDLTADEIIDRYVGKSGMVADLEARFGRTLPGFAERYTQLVRPLFEAPASHAGCHRRYRCPGRTLLRRLE